MFGGVMWRGVPRLWWLGGGAVVGALIALAGCTSQYLYGERETWRREAEAECLNSGAVKEGPDRVRISAIEGPGICGADFPLRISALGEGAPLGYDDEALRPPAAIPNGALPQHWPVQSNVLPPPDYRTAPPPQAQAVPLPASQQAGAPMSLYAPGVAPPAEDDDGDFQPAPPQPYGAAPGAPPRALPAPSYPPQSYPQPTYPSRPYPPPNYPQRAEPAPPGAGEYVPLGPQRSPMVTGTVGPVGVKPPATLACPIVSALDQWISAAVQPAALRWFRQPVVEIKQISAYSCRGMNGDPNAHISEHAFGNALDVAEFVLADGHRITVQYGWHGAPEEQGFLHDVQLAACREFSTVLAPGANVYHYNHIHVDLMRRSSGHRICQPAAIPGEIVAERARALYAARHPYDPGVTGSIKNKGYPRVLGYSGDDDRLPLAIPGED
jgi:hypothetical protein